MIPTLLAELKAGRIDAAVLVRPQSGGSSRLVWQNLAPAALRHAGAAGHARQHRRRSCCIAST